MRYLIVALCLLSSSAAFAQTADDNKRVAAAAFEFLNRTQITGAESDAMFRAKALLAAIANGQVALGAVERPKDTAPPK